MITEVMDITEAGGRKAYILLEDAGEEAQSAAAKRRYANSPFRATDLVGGWRWK